MDTNSKFISYIFEIHLVKRETKAEKEKDGLDSTWSFKLISQPALLVLKFNFKLNLVK